MIAILSDFGCSEYLGIMKGVIHSILPTCKTIDFCNTITSQNVKEAAWILYNGYYSFAQGTTFLCVVDPGVGSQRKSLVVKTNNYCFVGPDNGLIYPAANKDGITSIHEIDTPEKSCVTFHGRDVYAPAAAKLQKGEFSFDKPLQDMAKINIFPVERNGEVMRIDKFGNIITNLPPLNKEMYCVKIGEDVKELKIYKTYHDAPEGVLFLVQGCAKTLEISIKNRRANDALKVRQGEVIDIY